MTRTWKKLKTHKKILNFSKILKRTGFQIFRRSSKYFEDFDPQNILRKKPPNIKYWGLGLQGLWKYTLSRPFRHYETPISRFPSFREPQKTRFLENASEPRNLKKTLRFPRFRAWGFSWSFRGGPETPIFIAFRDLSGGNIFAKKKKPRSGKWGS